MMPSGVPAALRVLFKCCLYWCRIVLRKAKTRLAQRLCIAQLGARFARGQWVLAEGGSGSRACKHGDTAARPIKPQPRKPAWRGLFLWGRLVTLGRCPD